MLIMDRFTVLHLLCVCTLICMNAYSYRQKSMLVEKCAHGLLHMFSYMEFDTGEICA